MHAYEGDIGILPRMLSRNILLPGHEVSGFMLLYLHALSPHGSKSSKYIQSQTRTA